MTKEREAAIRYLGAYYDKEALDLLLSEERKPHPVHEEPIVRAFIAGAVWAKSQPTEEDYEETLNQTF